MFFSKSIAQLYDYIDGKVAALEESIALSITESKDYTDEQIVALPNIGNCNMKTGTYIGDDNHNRYFDIGVDLASKTHVYVIIKSTAAYAGIHRISEWEWDSSNLFIASAAIADGIQGFTSTGFLLGYNDTVNKSGREYHYTAFWID